jgi:RNA 2',3'-cyclic 3'-phosphodiesterase
LACEDPWRLFVGAFPPPALALSLESAIDDWKKKIPGRSVKWVSADKIHLTFCFLGNVDSGRVEALSENLEEAVSLHDRCLLNVSGLGVFPNLKRPRVLWAGATGSVSKLLEIQKAVSSVCAPLMESADEKSFSPHVTIARVKDPDRETIGALQSLVNSEVDRVFGEMPLEEVLLVRSELGGKGSIYTTLASFSLAKRG